MGNYFLDRQYNKEINIYNYVWNKKLHFKLFFHNVSYTLLHVATYSHLLNPHLHHLMFCDLSILRREKIISDTYFTFFNKCLSKFRKSIKKNIFGFASLAKNYRDKIEYAIGQNITRKNF